MSNPKRSISGYNGQTYVVIDGEKKLIADLKDINASMTIGTKLVGSENGFEKREPDGTFEGSGVATITKVQDYTSKLFKDYINGDDTVLANNIEMVVSLTDGPEVQDIILKGVRFWSLPVGKKAEDKEIEFTFSKLELV